MKPYRIAAAALGTFALACSLIAFAQSPPLNLTGSGGYKPIPNFTGPNAGEAFRGAINDRFSGVESISPRVVNLPFTDFPGEQDGLTIYCADCQKSSPCAGGGAGAFAFGQNGQWTCSGPGNALLNGQAAGGDLIGSLPSPSVATVLGGKSPLTQGMAGALLNGVSGAKSDGSDTLGGFNGAHDNEINVMAFGASGQGVTVSVASGSAGASTITASGAGWKPGQGIIVNHGGAPVTLAVPSAPTVTAKGTPGGSTCSYAIRALTAKRGYTAAGPAGATGACNDSRGAGAFNSIQWPAVTGAWGYEVERVSPNPALIAITTDTVATDFGQSSPFATYQLFLELPTTADSSSGADWLQTTVTAVAGNTLTLANQLGSSLNSMSYISHDDTAPITNAYNAAAAGFKKLYFPQGTYFFCGTPLNGSSINLLGAASQSQISICDGQYMFVVDHPMSRPSEIDGLTFVGGIGVLDATTTGPNTSNSFNVEFNHNLFYDFTGAAIAVEASDWPFWKVDHDFFQGLDYNNTMGLVLAGTSGNQVLNSVFGLMRIGVKMTNGGEGNTIANNTFLSTGAYSNASKPRVGIWLVPGANFDANNGNGLVVENNKYGNEGLASFDARNLWMTEGSGASTSTRMPAMVTLDDAAIAAASTTLTSAARCPFAATMCQGGPGCTGAAGNWGIVVQNAGRGLGAVSDALTTTISGFASSCSVTVANAASTTVSGQVARTAPGSLGEINGTHFVKNAAFGNGSIGAPPFIVSNAELGGGNDISYNVLYPGFPSEVFEQLAIVGDPNYTGNTAIGNVMVNGLGGGTPPGQAALSNVAGWLAGKSDPGQYFSRTGSDELSIPYPLTGDVGGSGPIGTLLAGSFGTASGASLIGNVPDSFGKGIGDAAEFSFSNGGDVFDSLGTVNANVPVWIYFETHSGSSAPVNRLMMQLTDANSAIVFSEPMTVSAGWHPWLFKWIPNQTAASMSLHFKGNWQDGNDNGRFQLGRVRVYQGWTPPPMVDQNINGDLAVRQANGSVGLAVARGTDSAPTGDLQDWTRHSGGVLFGIDAWGNPFTRVATIAYGATMTPDLSQGTIQVISATDGNALTINNPVNETAGIQWTLRLANASSGALGTISFGANFRVGSIVAPASGKSRILSCTWDGANNWCAENGSDL